MMRLRLVLATALIAMPAMAAAQTANPLTANARLQFGVDGLVTVGRESA